MVPVPTIKHDDSIVETFMFIKNKGLILIQIGFDIVYY